MHLPEGVPSCRKQGMLVMYIGITLQSDQLKWVGKYKCTTSSFSGENMILCVYTFLGTLNDKLNVVDKHQQ